MNKFKVYLAGRMSNLSYEVMNEWRVNASRLLKNYNDICTINPVNFYNFELDASTYTDREVKEFDLQMVKNSNCILVNLDNPNSLGTAIEIHMAHDVWGVPVISFGDYKNTHPWMQLSITKHCETMEKAIEHIIDFYYINK